MSYAPATLSALGSFWVAKGGVNLGIVGNASHVVGYHLGRDRIYDGADGPGIGDRDYSVQLARDKAGLSNAASAIDLGRLNGSYANLRRFSKWLVAQCMAEKPGYRDVREIIYSPDGDRVVRYSGTDGQIHTGPGNGDLSHRTHTHISYFRDSAGRDKRPLFAPYFAAPEEIVNSYPCPKVPSIGTVAAGTWLYATSALEANPNNVKVDPGRDLPYLGQPSTTTRIVEYVDSAGVHTGKAMFCKAPELLNIRPLPDASPFTQAEVDAANAAGYATAKANATTAVQGI